MEQDLACPHCGTYNDLNRGLYCTSCGKLLMNYCTNHECANSDAQNADIMCDERYCPICGSTTVFAEYGWLSE